MKTVPSPNSRVVVVGAGLAGLSAALHLRGAGHEVTVLERENTVGGRVGTYSLPGFDIDNGATVLTLPHLIDEALAAVGADRSGLDILPVEPAYTARFNGGRVIRVFSDPQDMASEVSKTCGDASVKGYRKLRRWMERVFLAEFDSFMASNFDTPLDMVRTGRSRRDLLKLTFLGGFGRLERRVGNYIRDSDLRRLFTFQSLYAGLPPAKALALYGAIPHMDTSMGVYFPRGGMRRIAEVMAEKFVAAGGRIETNADVTAVSFSDTRATSVTTSDGARYDCDALVLTVDIGSLGTLIPRRRKLPRRLRASPSCVVVHGSIPVSVAVQMPVKAHHTIDFGAEWSQTFDEITAASGQGRLMSDPSLLITRPALTDRSLRFERNGEMHEPLSILAPCPNLDSAPLRWEQLTDAYVQDLLSCLEGRGYPWLRTEYRIDRVDTPATWAAAGMLAGTPFSAAHLFRQTGPFRSPTLDRQVPNLVFCGSNTQPGVGVPMVLVSGRLAAERIVGAAPRRRR